MAGTLKIGLARCRQTGEFAMNADTIRRCPDKARHAAVQILCFPESQAVGYRADISTPTRPVPVGELEDLHAEVARFCGREGMACVLRTETPLAADSHRGKPHNSALVISETGAILGAHHKTKLPPFDAVADTPGGSIETFDLFGVMVGVPTARVRSVPTDPRVYVRGR